MLRGVLKTQYMTKISSEYLKHSTDWFNCVHEKRDIYCIECIESNVVLHFGQST